MIESTDAASSAAMPANPLLVTASRDLPRKVGVVGAGTIGPDIGYYLKSALPGLVLVIVDIARGALDAAAARMRDYVRKGRERGRLTEEQAADIEANLVFTLDYDALAECEWVIEAATEDLALKQRIFSQVEAIVADDAMLCSNTSSLPASRIFARLLRPERATVTHFFAPAWRNPVVEVVRWDRVSADTVGHLRRVLCATGKVPLVTADVPCFMLDRVFDNWCNDAALLLDRATAAQIDAVAGEFVHAGPFFVLNLAHGNPIIVETNTLQANEEGEHYRPAPIFRSVDRWLTGTKAAGTEVNPQAAASVRDRLLGVLISQSVDILDRQIGEPADLEIGCRLALGFRKGPLDLMRDLGEREVTRIVDRFTRVRAGMPAPRRPLSDYQRFARRVLVDSLGDVVVITLRRPEALNALDDTMTDEILDTIRARESDPGVAGFVIVGYGTRAFCAGADIGRFPSMLGDADASTKYAADCSRLLVHLDSMHKPVVAAVNGMALGGGFELAMRCHGIVAVRDAWMQLPEITLGIVPGIGALVVPYRRWPQCAALFHRMLREAARVDAREAYAEGVVDALADDYPSLIDKAIARVRSLAGRVRSLPDRIGAIEPPAAIEPRSTSGQLLSREVLAIVDDAIVSGAKARTLREALEAGYRAFGRSACTAAAKEGIAAFMEKRAPDFGRTG